MSINVGQVSTNLSDGLRFYAYSGDIQGDITVPASITLISIPNTGLKDSFVKIQPFFGSEISSNVGDALGLSVTIDGITIYNSQVNAWRRENVQLPPHEIELFIPRQSNLVITSLNTAANNTQLRGCNMLGWCL